MNDWSEKIDFLLSNQKFVVANIWDKKNNSIATFVEVNPADLKKQVVAFLAFWEKQNFKIVFRQSKTQALENGFVHFIDTQTSTEIKPIVEVQTIQGNSNVDVEAQIQNGINSALEKIDLKKQKEEVEEKKEELKSTAGQIAIVVQQLVQVFAPQYSPMQAPINGIEIMDVDITEDKEVNNALTILVKHTKKEDLIKIAKAVEKDPSLISKAVMMLG